MSAPTSSSVVSLVPDRSLLNVRFDNYKLKLSGGVGAVRHLPLDKPVLVDQVPATTFLPFRKLEARSSFNHLFPAPGGGVFYIDTEYTLIHFGVQGGEVAFKVLHRIPRPDCPAEEREYPSLTCSSDFLLVSNGAGLVQLLLFNQSEMAVKLVGLVAGINADEDAYNVLVASRYVQASNQLLCLGYSMPELTSNDGKQELKFDITMWTINLANSFGSILSATRVCGLAGFSVPLFAAIESTGEGFVVGSSNPYESVHQQPPSSLPTSSTTTAQPSTEPPPAYFWNQTETDVTITIALPHFTQKHDVHIHFDPSAIHVRINPPKELEIFSRDRKLFDNILTNDCIWTLENNRTLTLYLRKSNTKTKWAGIWNDIRAEDVPETVDPEMMAEFLERLEKYTLETVEENADGSKAPIFQALTERSEAIDFEGNSVILERASKEGVVTHICYGAGHEWLGPVLRSQESEGSLGAICLQSDVDGLVYTVKDGFALQHVSSFNAFGFVQASKRDKKFVVVSPGPEYRYAAVVESVKHVYLYRKGREGEIFAEQYVVDLTENEAETGGEAGQVVGVQMVGENALLILKEDRIIAIQLL
ncbi:NudC domain-containing protein 1 [Rhizophlyctis rosea]|nr:NudC domain-containing protein 1 [Rhizophlyctis rosea]